jgi:prevent-host-death family protein
MRAPRLSAKPSAKRSSRSAGKALPVTAVDPGVVQATVAKNRFGAILKRARAGEAVVIAKHGIPEFVVLEYQRYFSLIHQSRGQDELSLDALRDEFDVLYAQMQSSKSRQGVDRLLSTSADSLNQTAARRAKDRGST